MAVPGLAAGIDPAVQTTETGVWMPGSIPGLDLGTGMTAAYAPRSAAAHVDGRGSPAVTKSSLEVNLEFVRKGAFSRRILQIKNHCILFFSSFLHLE
jgi:hypothetical protein